MPPLAPFLSTHLSARPVLAQTVLPALLRTLPRISAALRTTTVASAENANTFGDTQLNVDVLAESVIRDAIASCGGAIASASSEEDAVERPGCPDTPTPTGEEKETYTLAFDPLDGSSIIPANWSVGTIMGIWDGTTALSETAPPRERQVGAILGVLGPRCGAVVALRLPGERGVCFEVALTEDGEGMDVVREDVRFTPAEGVKTKYFAPANLRAAAENAAYGALVQHWIGARYTLRYSGGLVPDVYHALVKGHGVYASPVTEASPAKLRRLYELAPVALVVECAGGKAVDSKDGTDVLDTPVRDTDERGGLICGNVDEVEIAVRMLGL